jgi:myb proto-oncogene protein
MTREGRWTAVEDSKLQYAVQTHGDKDWVAISAQVPGRTKGQCWQRWHDVLDPNICRASRRRGEWTAFEDRKLKDAVQTQQGDKDWVAISVLVPGRTRKQCCERWTRTLRGKEYGTLKRAPVLGRDPHSP